MLAIGELEGIEQVSLVPVSSAKHNTFLHWGANFTRNNNNAF